MKNRLVKVRPSPTLRPTQVEGERDRKGGMRKLYVSGEWRYLSLVLIWTLLTACTAANPNVSYLSFSLPSLKNTGDSPFDQNLESNGYIELRGQCDSSVESLQMQFDDEDWKEVPGVASAPPSGITAPAVNYDTDCSDGAFHFYLFSDDVGSFLPPGTNLETYSPKAIRLRGISGPFATEPLEFLNGSGQENLTEANAFHLSAAHWHVEVGLCLPINISLAYRESSGSSDFRVKNSSNRIVNLTTSSFAFGNVHIYSDASCSQLLASSPQIPAGETSVDVYIRANGGTGTVGSVYDSGQVAISISGMVAVDMGMSSASRYFQFSYAGEITSVSFSDGYRETSNGGCQDIALYGFDANDILSSRKAGSVLPVNLAIDSGLTLYEGVDCRSGQELSGSFADIASGEAIHLLSYRSADDDFRKIVISTGMVTPRAPAQHEVNPWVMAHRLTVADAFVFPTLPYQAPDCRPLLISSLDSAGNLASGQPATESYMLQLYNSGAMVSFYSDSQCMTNLPMGYLPVSSGQTQWTVWWKATPGTLYSSVMTINVSQTFAMGMPARFSAGYSESMGILSLPVTASIYDLGTQPPNVWHFPRFSLVSGMGESLIPQITELTGNPTNPLFVTAGALVSHVVQAENGRFIGQRVGTFDGVTAVTAVNENISTTTPYVFSVLFRATSGGDQDIAGFTDEDYDVLSLTSGGQLSFMGCTFGSNLADGSWHQVAIARPVLSGGSAIIYQIDQQAPQSCVIPAPTLAAVPATFNKGFAVGRVRSGSDGLDGQLAEVIYLPGYGAINTADTIFTVLRAHLENRYPLVP